MAAAGGHAVPGVRLGYVTDPAARIAQVAALQPSWAVSATALTAGHAMLAVERWQRDAVPAATAVRAQLAAGFAVGGIEVVEGRANFLLARVGDAALHGLSPAALHGLSPAGAFRLALLRRGFAVRDYTSFGLPEWVRVAVPVEAAAQRLLVAWGAALAETSETRVARA